ncbi:MBL fold metallo-hydrolase [Sulfurimonas sp.]
MRDTFKDEYREEEKIDISESNLVKVLGAFGTKAKGYGTSSFFLNDKNVIDAGNLLVTMDEKSANIQNIWITHSHLDHICDIAYIIDNYFSLIKETIHICALPETIESIRKHFLNGEVWPDFSKIKLENKSGMCIEYVEIEFDKEYKLSSEESIKAIKTDHTIPSCGYIYKKNDTAILITADTHSLDNVIEILNNDKTITTAIIECSFPVSMEKLAIASKHLTPKLLSEMLKELKREDLDLYINHIKPAYLEEITKEIELYCSKWDAKIVKDGEIVKF